MLCSGCTLARCLADDKGELLTRDILGELTVNNVFRYVGVVLQKAAAYH